MPLLCFIHITAVSGLAQSLTICRTDEVEYKSQTTAEAASESKKDLMYSDAMVQLSQAYSHTAESLREINNSIAQLKDAAQGLRQEISHFKV